MGIQRKHPNQMSRKKNDPLNQPKKYNPIRITAATASGNVLTLTINQAISMKSTPGITTNVAGAEPVSAELTAPNVVAITYSASVAAAEQVIIPPQDPGIRNKVGGFVADSTFPLAA